MHCSLISQVVRAYATVLQERVLLAGGVHTNPPSYGPVCDCNYICIALAKHAYEMLFSFLPWVEKWGSHNHPSHPCTRKNCLETELVAYFEDEEVTVCGFESDLEDSIHESPQLWVKGRIRERL